jgi:hypothetical protein
MKSIRLSLGVVPTLIIAAAASTLAGCSGTDGESAPNATKVAGAGTAGTGSVETGGSGGSSGTAGKSGTGGSAGSEQSGGTGGGSAGKSGSGGSGSTSTGGSGSEVVNDGKYSRDEFAVAEPDLADPFHPFEQRETTLLRREEAAVYVPTGSTVAGFTLDHPEKAFAELSGSPAQVLAGMTTFDTTAANLDEDGNDELVGVGAVTGGLAVRVADSSASGLFVEQQGFNVAGTFDHAWVEAADVDEDGRDELLVAAVTSTGVVAKLYDDATQGFAPLGDVKVGPGEEIAVAFGNFDGDRFPELAVLTDEGSTLELELFDDARAGWASLGSISEGATGLVDQWGLAVSGLMLESGNLDADGQDELVLFADGISADTNNGSVDAIQSIGIDVTGVTGGVATLSVVNGSKRSFPAPQDSAYRDGNRWPWHATLADSNDDGIVETFVVDRHFGDNTYVVDLFHEVYGTDAASWTIAPSVVTLNDDVAYDAPVHLAKVTGRSNGLGADIVAVVRDDDRLEMYRVTLDTTEIPSSDPLTESTFSFTQRMETLTPRPIASASDQVFVTGGDWDADSLRLRFTGEKWMALARPRPIVILAAPPAKAGISQNYDGTTTSYAVSSTNSSSKGNEYSVSDKVTLSFEVSVPGADFISAGAGASMSQQFSKTHTKTESVTYGKEFGGAYPKDVIVFNGTLCARYRYEVVSGGDGGQVGTFMTIDVPQESRIYKWTVEYYNKSLQGLATPIDDTVLTHTVGDPASYMTAAEKNQRKGSGAWVWPVASPVGQGPGADTVYIAVGEEVSDETATTESTEYSGKAGAFVTAEYTRGYDESEIYSVTLAKETVFTGTVGDIDLDDDYENWRYSYGLLVYPTMLAGGERVRVVTYWTEGLIGDGYATP